MIRGELDVRLVTTTQTGRQGPVRFDVDLSPSALTVHGGFSMGNDGWTLQAYARTYRNRILASVVASQSPGQDDGQMCELDYRMEIQAIKPGRHMLQVRHVFRPAPGEGLVSDLIVFESIVVVLAGVT